jgi:hypothetical protein
MILALCTFERSVALAFGGWEGVRLVP